MTGWKRWWSLVCSMARADRRLESIVADAALTNHGGDGLDGQTRTQQAYRQARRMEIEHEESAAQPRPGGGRRGAVPASKPKAGADAGGQRPRGHRDHVDAAGHQFDLACHRPAHREWPRRRASPSAPRSSPATAGAAPLRQHRRVGDRILHVGRASRPHRPDDQRPPTASSPRPGPRTRASPLAARRLRWWSAPQPASLQLRGDTTVRRRPDDHPRVHQLLDAPRCRRRRDDVR